MLTGDGAAQAPYRAAGTAEVRAARAPGSRARASAERQCHLVAGGAHTRLLWDCPAHHPQMLLGLSGLFMLVS